MLLYYFSQADSVSCVCGNFLRKATHGWCLQRMPWRRQRNTRTAKWPINYSYLYKYTVCFDVHLHSIIFLVISILCLVIFSHSSKGMSLIIKHTVCGLLQSTVCGLPQRGKSSCRPLVVPFQAYWNKAWLYVGYWSVNNLKN